MYCGETAAADELFSDYAPKLPTILGRNKEEFGFCSHTGAGEPQLPPTPPISEFTKHLIWNS